MIVIYDHKTFIVQATGCTIVTNPSEDAPRPFQVAPAMPTVDQPQTPMTRVLQKLISYKNVASIVINFPMFTDVYNADLPYYYDTRTL